MIATKTLRTGLTFAVILAGCGEAFSPSQVDEFTALLAVEGTIASAVPVADDGGIRVALLWRTETGFELAGDAPATPSMQTDGWDFRLSIGHFPQDSAILPLEQLVGPTSGAQDATVAVGGLVVYRDVNESRELERKELGAACSVDELLGVSQHHTIWHVAAGALSGELGGFPNDKNGLGFALRKSSEPCFPQLVCSPGNWQAPGIRAFDRPVVSGLALDLDPALVRRECPITERIAQYGECSAKRTKLDKFLRDECPLLAPKCSGNGGRDTPVVSYSSEHRQLLEDMTRLGCCPALLGTRPWTCSPTLGCPSGYGCVDYQCTKDATSFHEFRWVWVPEGTFGMGSAPTDPCYSPGEALHEVRLSRSFLIANSEVTQGQFRALMGTNPSWFASTDQGGYADCQDCPVENVSWYEAAAYCNELSTRSGLPSCYECRGSGAEFSCGERKEYQAGAIYDCRGYRLPTEAEWEYAYRAGTQTAFYNGPITSCSEYDLNADQIGWHSPENEKALERPQPVMQKMPNGWGLYDMAGNVAELCQDWYHYIDEVRPAPAVEVDPVWYQFSTSDPGRVVRGGDFSSKPTKLRGSARAWRLEPNCYTGFRCVRQ